ncbi:MAG TPA: glycosyltransferase [Candidatus Acidoferrales bacterium]|nr:glycosyltransferase [Candidatus Acidoferrales bacterium]
MTAKIAFWISVSWVGYVYVGYPAGLWLLGSIRRRRFACSEDSLPTVSVLVSARNEEKDIGWKVRDTLNCDYPPEKIEMLVASDASDDGTDDVLRSIADPRFRFVQNPRRMGKNLTLNRLTEMATGEVLFFTDANSHIPADCFRKMTAHFADPKVGCVTGWERAEEEGADPGMSAGGGAYLGYEATINSLESALGSVLVCDGSVFCMRKSLFAPVQPDLANDLELPLRIGAQGYAVLYEPQAYSTEKNTSSPSEEFNRRRRICGQGILGFWRLRQQLTGLRAWQFISRKLMRWLATIPMTVALITSATLASNRFFLVLFILQACFYIAALLGWFLVSVMKKSSRLLALPFYFMLVNLSAVTGIVEACLGRRFAVWEIPTLSRGREETQ